MKKIFFPVLISGCLSVGHAQDNTAPFYLPGDGIYLVGLPSDLSVAVTEPTMVTQAYQAKLITSNAELAATRSGFNNYNVTKYFNPEFSELDLTHFLGIGELSSLIVRDMEGGSYELGHYSPVEGLPHCRVLAAYDSWEGHKTFPLCMYDQWDCPVSFDADTLLSKGFDAITVCFSDAHEGLVISNVNFPLAIAAGSDMNRNLQVKLLIGDSKNQELSATIYPENLNKVADREGFAIYSAVATFASNSIVIDTTFQVTVSGFAQEGLNAWIPRAVDTHGFYPTHTTYSGQQGDVCVDAADACINVEGYFNYLGTYGWYDGKYERGEVVSSADLVQIYYDPADVDWPGDYFMGEAAFPVECTFGSKDVTILETPDWINSISYDDSQWEEYGALQIILSADALPSELNGRNGKVVLVTSDLASYYTIYIRQGAAWFDMPNDIKDCSVINAPVKGGVFDLSGRTATRNSKGLFIHNNKIVFIK